MDITSTLASISYQTALNAAKPSPDGASQDSVAKNIADFATEFVQELSRNEKIVADGLVGKADTHSVVTAMAATELAVETAVTVRDKVVEAYQEILRMPV